MRGEKASREEMASWLGSEGKWEPYTCVRVTGIHKMQGP